jgi:hypothetical protein
VDRRLAGPVSHGIMGPPMTITSGAPVRFERRQLRRRTLIHPFVGHQPRHRRLGPGRNGDRAGLSAGLAGRSGTACTGSLNGRTYRAWGLGLGVLAWVGFVGCHAAALPQATAVFAALTVLTWGLALAAVVPTADGLEFSVVTVATSAALVVLVGMLLVELRWTAEFFWVFVGVGALSLAVQIVAILVQVVVFRIRSAPPQPVPSLIDGRIIREVR